MRRQTGCDKPLFKNRDIFRFFILFVVILSCLLTTNGYSRQGGSNTWEFLNLTNSARVASLGGKNISLRDGDLNLVFHNPALLDSTMNNNLVINYVNYFAGINFGYASWSRHSRNLGSFAAGIHYIDYGKFTGADDTGVITGDFSARENSVNLSWAAPLDTLFTFGATLKIISSNFEQYRSFGAAIDAGINYYNPEMQLSASFTIRNLGRQLTTWYPGGEKEPLPFEMQLGLTKRLEHAPFRISVLCQHLQDFNLRKAAPDKTQTDQKQDLRSKAESAGTEFIRHIIVGAEFIPVSSFSVQAGYNNLRRAQLKLEERASTAGLSWGVTLQLRRFTISYGQAR